MIEELGGDLASSQVQSTTDCLYIAAYSANFQSIITASNKYKEKLFSSYICTDKTLKYII